MSENSLVDGLKGCLGLIAMPAAAISAFLVSFGILGYITNSHSPESEAGCWYSLAGLLVSGAVLYWAFSDTKPPTPAPIREPQSRTHNPKPDHSLDPKWFELKLGAAQQWEAHRARVLLEALLNLARNTQVDLRFVAKDRTFSISIYYHVGYPSLEAIASAVQAAYPDMEVEESPSGSRPSYPTTHAHHIFARSKRHPFFETVTSTAFQQDPLALLTLAMDRLHRGESLVFGVSCIDTMIFSDADIEDLLKMSKWDAGERPKHYYKKKFVEQAIDAFYETARLKNTKIPVYRAGDERRFEEKLSQTNYLIALWMYLVTPDEARLEWFDTLVAQARGLATSRGMIVAGTADKLTVTSSSQYNQAYPPRIMRRWQDEQLNHHLLAVTLDELAALWHIPHDGFTARNLEWRVNAPLPDELKAIDGVLVGRSGRDEVRLPTSLKFKTEHMAIIGRTGMGKSAFMQTMLHDDIQAGRGVMVLDPKGDLVRDILRHSIPPEREDDVVVLDIFERIGEHRYPPPLNPLSSRPDDLTAILDSLFKAAWQSTRANDWVSLALHTLNFFEGATVRDIKRVIQDQDFREQLLATGVASSNPDIRLAISGLREAWRDFEATLEKQSSIDAINRRLNTFTTDGQLLALTCNPQPLRLAEWIGQNKIILVALGRDFEGQQQYGKSLKKQELQILGTSLVSQIFRVAMSGRIPLQSRPFALYIDEAHLFKTAPLDEMLALVRGRGLGMALSTQSLNLLVEGMLEAFEDNVGAIVSFQVSRTNANQLSAYMSPPFGDHDLERLNRYQAAVFIKDETGRQHPAFQLTTAPPPGFEPGILMSVDDDTDAMEQLQQERSQRLQTALDREQRIRQKSVNNLGLKTYSEVADLIVGDEEPTFTLKNYTEDEEEFIFNDDDQAGDEEDDDEGLEEET